MGQNILSAGKDVLLEIRGQVLELDGSRARVDELTMEEDKQERALALREKQISDEIADTLKKRKDEVGAAFLAEEEKLKTRLKKLKSKKEKYKSGKVSERIVEETAGLTKENADLKEEAKTAFRQAHAPRCLNTAVYYGLFMPKGVQDYLLCAGVFLLLFVAVPVGTHFLLPEKMAGHWSSWVVIYLVCILLFGGLYVYIHNHTKEKHGEALIKGRRIRSKIRFNKRTMSKIRRQIIKDKDESIYGLESFDQEIGEVQAELEDTLQRRKDALRVFEETTRGLIIEEIRGRYQADVDKMKEQHEETYRELRAVQEKVKQKSLYVAENYEAFLGREFVNLAALDVMLTKMEEGKAETIGAALACYKEEGNV